MSPAGASVVANGSERHVLLHIADLSNVFSYVTVLYHCVLCFLVGENNGNLCVEAVLNLLVSFPDCIGGGINAVFVNKQLIRESLVVLYKETEFSAAEVCFGQIVRYGLSVNGAGCGRGGNGCLGGCGGFGGFSASAGRKPCHQQLRRKQ